MSEIEMKWTQMMLLELLLHLLKPPVKTLVKAGAEAEEAAAPAATSASISFQLLTFEFQFKFVLSLFQFR